MDSVSDKTEKLTLEEFEITNTSSGAYPGTIPGKGWSPKDFKKKLKVEVVREEGMEMEFDLIGVDASLANAVRRILISEVPTMAIEKIHMLNNTSIIQDEVFAHRLGLIPLRADPRQFEWKSAETDDAGDEKDTLEFRLKVKCKRSPTAAELAEEACVDKNVYTKHIKWIPRGGQSKWVSGGDPGPVEQDILLNKLLPGHEIELTAYAYKGIGADHAKFSPVATAFYRLLPEITIKRDVTGDQAVRLQRCFSPGVIQLVHETDGTTRARVKDARNDACSRNVYRHEDLKDLVELTKVRDHFIFNVESTGAMRPRDLVVQSLQILEEKCDIFLKELDTSA